MNEKTHTTNAYMERLLIDLSQMKRYKHLLKPTNEYRIGSCTEALRDKKPIPASQCESCPSERFCRHDYGASLSTLLRTEPSRFRGMG